MKLYNLFCKKRQRNTKKGKDKWKYLALSNYAGANSQITSQIKHRILFLNSKNDLCLYPSAQTTQTMFGHLSKLSNMY